MNFGNDINLILWLLMASCTKVVISCVAKPGAMTRVSPRKEFYVHESVPKASEFSEIASGKPSGPIRRNSEKYKRLWTSYNPGIIFQEGGSGNTRLMTKRCMDMLHKLEKLVKQRWPKIKLRVLSAWDDETDHMHDGRSLHYEGRAVDLSTSDTDSSKLGSLAGLAVEAGFDWVRYVHRSRVHASVRDEENRNGAPGCFRSNSTVRLESGQVKKLNQIKIGDKVQSVNKNGEIMYSEVIMFIDNKPNEKDVMYFVLETTKPRAKLYLTMAHLVYVKKRFSSFWTVAFAKNVRKGDFVNVTSSDGKMVAAEVTSISVSPQRGAIAPLTSEGNIIVDGVLASCYALLEDQEFIDSIFWPARSLYKLFPSLLNSELNGQQGIHWYARLLLYLNDYFSVLT